MGYPPPPAGPPPPFPFEQGGDIGAGQAQIAAAPSNAVAAAAAAQAAALAAAQAQRAVIMAPAVAAQAAATQAATNLQDALTTETVIAVGATLPTGSIVVADASGFASPGTFLVGGQWVRFTGVSGNTLTGCTGGTGAVNPGDPVQTAGNPSNIASAQQALGVASANATQANITAAQAVAAAEEEALAALAAVASALALAEAAKQKLAAITGTTPASALTAGLKAEIAALEAQAEGAVGFIETLCAIFEAGLTLSLGGNPLDFGATLTASLSADASAGVTATCCGFTLDIEVGFVINFQLPAFALNLELLLPYIGFTISCDPGKPVNISAGLPYGGGRVSNSEPDPDLSENDYAWCEMGPGERWNRNLAF
jgi:hypothetical protein